MTLAGLISVTVLVFCRCGAALLLMPGFSSARFPLQVRLLVALALSASLTPLLAPGFGAAAQGEVMSGLILSELLTGGMIGLMGRLYLQALSFAGTVMANALGLSGIPGQPIDDTEAAPPIATLFSLAGVMMIFATNLHLETVRALRDSYGVLPPGPFLSASFMATQVIQTLARTAVLALQFSGPFLVYAVVLNFAIGLASKFTPQLSIYFATLGIATVLGLVLLRIVAPDVLAVFVDRYGAWLRAGQ
ncbi:MAG TPA: flagellar biosynthetic protein FliR [Aestuariivirga sp.]|nr:flagellar biosynthetic protein FliR [Aestuariivirga sp.]